MNTIKCIEKPKTNTWLIRIPESSPEYRADVAALAKKHRMSTGAFLASLADKALAEEKKAN